MGGTRAALAVVVSVMVAVWACSCAASSATPSGSPSASVSSTASPPPVDLTLPTTIHFGNGTVDGAVLTEPTSKARVSWKQALALNDLHPQDRLTGTVLADVTMPNDYLDGKPIRNLTCWVYVFTASKPFDASLGGPMRPSPSTKPSPLLVWHSVFVLDARDGRFVRGFFTE